MASVISNLMHGKAWSARRYPGVIQIVIIPYLTRADDLPSKNIGSLCALPFAPYMADILGRKSCIVWGACLMIIGTVIQTASQSVHMFIGARHVSFPDVDTLCLTLYIVCSWLIGFGLNFAATGAPMLISELAYPSKRQCK